MEHPQCDDGQNRILTLSFNNPINHFSIYLSSILVCFKLMIQDMRFSLLALEKDRHFAVSVKETRGNPFLELAHPSGEECAQKLLLDIMSTALAIVLSSYTSIIVIR
jgi:hypothetical protein